MGGKGSGRKDRTTELLSNSSVQKFTPIADNDIFIPNHSGISTHPEMLGTKGFVKKSGDTMTGKLIIDKNDSANTTFIRLDGSDYDGARSDIDFISDNTGSRHARISAHTSNAPAAAHTGIELKTSNVAGDMVTRFRLSSETDTPIIEFNVNNFKATSGTFDFDDDNMTTTGTLNAGVTTINSDLILNTGSITSASGAISFGNENLSTTGTLTVTKLEVNDSSLTNATGHISSTSTVWNPKAYGTIGASTLQLSSDVTAGDDNYGASLSFSRIDTEVAKGAAIVAVQTSSDVDNTGLSFFTHPSTSTSTDLTEQMRIEHDGKIGIGTTSPSTILHAKDAGVNSAPAITLENDARAFSFEVDGSDGDKLKIRTDVFTRDIMSFEDDSKAQMMDFTNSAITINGANQDIDFIVKDDAGNTAFFIQGSDGNVGIGTSSPSEQLEVIGNITANKTSSDVEITGETTNADARLVLKNTGNGRHSGIQLIRERLSGTGVTAASIFVNSDTSTNNSQLIIQCNSSTNIGSQGPTDQRIILDAATDTMDIDNSGVRIQEIASAKADKAGYGQIWVKNTTPCELWFTDDAGTDTQIV